MLFSATKIMVMHYSRSGKLIQVAQGFTEQPPTSNFLQPCPLETRDFGKDFPFAIALERRLNDSPLPVSVNKVLLAHSQLDKHYMALKV